jgi:hypothetical protein
MFQFRINSRHCDLFGGFLGYVDRPIAMVPPPHDNTNTDKERAFIQASTEICTKSPTFQLAATVIGMFIIVCPLV